MTPSQPALSAPLSVVRADTALAYDDVVAFEGITLRELFNRVREGRYQAVPSGEKSRNGRAVMLVKLSSLTPAAQAKYLAQVKDVADGVAAPAVKAVAPDRRVRGAAIPTLPNGAVDTEALQRAGRHTELQAFLKRSYAVSVVMAERDKLQKKGAKGAKCLMWRRLEVSLNCPAPTLRRWLHKYKTGGSPGLVPGYGHNRGEYLALPEELRRAIRASYLTQQRQTVSQIMQNCVRPWCAERGRLAPDRTTVARFFEKEILACEVYAFRGGHRKWQEKVMAKVRRNPSDLSVNDLWCADHRKFDFFVLAPDGHRVIRPWLTCYEDVASADLTGWCVREKPNSQSVALALRAGMIKRGVPRALYHDNGKEFTAKRFGGGESWRAADPTIQDVESASSWPALLPMKYCTEIGFLTLHELGVHRVINAIPFSSWSKPIEPWFHAFHREWENLMPGYCGNNPQNQPEKCKREVKERRLVMWDQFVEILRKRVDDWAANHRCGDRKSTPDEFYRAAQAELRMVPEGKLDGLMLVSENRAIPPDGIEIGGRRFLDEQLALFIGERADVLYDPDNLTHIIAKPCRYQGQKRLIVAQIPYAGWFAFSRANELIQGIQKSQRDQLRAVATSDRAALVPDYIDPDGANRMAVENARAHRVPAEPRSVPVGSAAGPVQLIKAAAAADRAESRAAENSRKSHAAAVAARIAAQARAEDAHQKGESA